MTDLVGPPGAEVADAPVLLVEDDPADVVMTREAFELHHITNPLHVVGSGEDALRFLRRQAPYTDAPRPALVVLDLNLPGKNGHEVLAEIKTDPELRAIPVVVLTTSAAEEDILRSYDTSANAHVTKPLDVAQFMNAIRQIDEFFVKVAQRPTAR